MKFVCILTTVPDKVLARKMAASLVSKRLAACVHLFPVGESHYSWKSKQEKFAEIQLVIKTRAVLFKKIESFFKRNHPYEVPEIIAIPILKSAAPYARWMKTATES